MHACMQQDKLVENECRFVKLSFTYLGHTVKSVGFLCVIDWWLPLTTKIATQRDIKI